MNRLNFQFRHQPTEDSRYAPLIYYYNKAKQDLVVPKKDFVMNALEAFWLPFAVKWSGGSSEEVANAVTRSVYLLEHHIELLRYRFGAKTMQPTVSSPPTPLYPNRHSFTESVAEDEVEDDLNFDEDCRDYDEEDSLLDSMF